MGLDIVLRKFYESIKATRSLSNYPSTLDIARNKVPTSRPFQIEGYRETTNTAIQDLSELPTDIIPVPSLAGENMQIVSTSSNDTLAGSNAQKVMVEYIEPVTEKLKQIEVDLNGTIAVNVPVSIAFVSDFYVSQSNGIDVESAGDITIFNGATVYGIIKSGTNKSQTCMRYVPKNKALHITSLNISGNNKDAAIRLRANVTDNYTRTNCFIFRTNEIVAGSPNSTYFDPPIVIPPQTYLKISIYPSGSNTGNISATISGFIENAGSIKAN